MIYNPVIQTLFLACFGAISNFVEATGSFKDFKDCLVSSGVDADSAIAKGDSDYNYVNFQWNLRKPMEPTGYLKAGSAKDIQAAVKCGRKLGVSVVPRCGGHSYEKYSYNSNGHVVIDLSRINQVISNKETMIAEIGSGVLLGHAYYHLWEQGKFAIPAGTCPTVGASGHILGGGYGMSSRKHGLMIDRVKEIEMVNAEGELLILNEKTNADLFWAMRGAGAGNFGIVTKWKISIFDASKQVLRIALAYPWSQFDEVFEAWQNWAAKDPNPNVTALLHLNKFNGPVLNAVIQEGSQEEAEKLAAEIKSIFPKGFKQDRSQEFMDFIDMVIYYGDLDITDRHMIPKVDSHIHKPFYFKAKSFYNNHKINAEEKTRLKAAFEGMPKDGYMLLDLQGGAINKLARSDTAFVHRRKHWYSIQLVNQAGTVEEGDAHMPWINKFAKDTAFIYNDEAYFNYIDQDLEDFNNKYFGSNLPKLIGIKQRHDPTNYFRNNQSLPIKF